jgi:hypothetical protein
MHPPGETTIDWKCPKQFIEAGQLPSRMLTRRIPGRGANRIPFQGLLMAASTTGLGLSPSNIEVNSCPEALITLGWRIAAVVLGGSAIVVTKATKLTTKNKGAEGTVFIVENSIQGKWILFRMATRLTTQ